MSVCNLHVSFLPLVTMLVTGACGSTPEPSPTVPPLPPDCLRLRVGPIDPHGQGSDLLGLGLVRSNVLFRIDQFDLDRITDRAGHSIDNVSIDASHALHGTVDLGPSQGTEPADWITTTLVGKAHCASLSGEPRLADIKVQIGEMSWRRIGGVNVQTYRLELIDNGQVVNACRDPDDVAFPVRGYWDDTGSHVVDGTSFSFVCTKRDVATCLDEGYIDNPEEPTRYTLFKACTRMLRADYCGNGESHTVDGSFVTMYDSKKIAMDGPLDPLVFEAAWNENGAVCMARPRWLDKKPTCQSPVPECPPGVNRDTAGSLSAAPLVFNESCIDHPCTVARTEFDDAPVARALLRSIVQP